MSIGSAHGWFRVKQVEIPEEFRLHLQNKTIKCIRCVTQNITAYMSWCCVKILTKYRWNKASKGIIERVCGVLSVTFMYFDIDIDIKLG